MTSHRVATWISDIVADEQTILGVGRQAAKLTTNLDILLEQLLVGELVVSFVRLKSSILSSVTPTSPSTFLSTSKFRTRSPSRTTSVQVVAHRWRQLVVKSPLQICSRIGNSVYRLVFEQVY